MLFHKFSCISSNTLQLYVCDFIHQNCILMDPSQSVESYMCVNSTTGYQYKTWPV